MDGWRSQSNKPNKSLSISDLSHTNIRIEELYRSEPSRHILIRHISLERPINDLTVRSHTFSQTVSTTGDAVRTDRSVVNTTEFRIMSAEDVPFDRSDDSPNIFDSDSYHVFGFTKQLPDDIKYRPRTKTEKTEAYECSDTNSMRDVHEIDPNPSRPSKKVPKLDISETNKVPAKSKKPRRPAVDPTRAGDRRSVWTVISFVTLPIFVLVMGLVLFDYGSENETFCGFESDAIVDDLHRELFGQDRAISILTQVFDNLSERNLLMFLGGTGVGKTYASSVIMRNVRESNVHLMIFPSDSSTGDGMKIVNNLSPCGYNLVVVDTLRPADVLDIVPFVDALFRSNKKIIVVLIFNIQKHSNDLKFVMDLPESRRTIENAFPKHRFDPVTIVFEQLAHESLLKCIRRSLAERGIEETSEAVRFVAENVDVTTSGCKRVDSKAALLKGSSGSV